MSLVWPRAYSGSSTRSLWLPPGAFPILLPWCQWRQGYTIFSSFCSSSVLLLLLHCHILLQYFGSRIGSAVDCTGTAAEASGAVASGPGTLGVAFYTTD